MSARKSDSIRAQKVLDTIGETFSRIEAYDISEERFISGDDIETRALADSLPMCVLRVTEEAGKLSDTSKRLHPEIDWRGVAGMRNYLAHDYGNVDRRMVWETVTEEFALLANACGQIAEEAH